VEISQAQQHFPKKRGRPKKQPVVPVGREQQKIMFLQKLVEFGRVTLAMREAGIPNSSYYKLREEGYITDEEINFAVLQHVDNIYHAALEWGLKGIPTYVSDGHGHHITMPDGSPQVEYKRSEKIFLKLLDADPTFRKHISEVMHTGNGYQPTIIDSDIKTDIVHTVLHVCLVEYDEEGQRLLISAMREAELSHRIDGANKH
jgi:hypothetical protein